jgi:hypothetical protein
MRSDGRHLGLIVSASNLLLYRKDFRLANPPAHGACSHLCLADTGSNRGERTRKRGGTGCPQMHKYSFGPSRKILIPVPHPHRNQHLGCLGNLLLRFTGLLAQETKQFGVHFFGVRPDDAVRAVLYHQVARPFDELGGTQS